MKRKSFINEIMHIRPGQVEIYGFSSLSQSIAAVAQIALLNSLSDRNRKLYYTRLTSRDNDVHFIAIYRPKNIACQ